MLEVFVPLLWRTVLKIDQKPYINLRYQQLLIIRFLQSHRCRNTFDPRIWLRTVTAILQNFRTLHVVQSIDFFEVYRAILSLCYFPFPSGSTELKVESQCIRFKANFTASSTGNAECTHAMNTCRKIFWYLKGSFALYKSLPGKRAGSAKQFKIEYLAPMKLALF